MLSCTARGGPDNEFRWNYNGISMDTQLLEVGNLTISDVLVEYFCTVHNPAGEGRDSTAVYLEPRFVSEPTDVFTRANDTVTFTCLVQGNPIPDIVWEYGGEMLDVLTFYEGYGSGTDVTSGIGPESKFRVFETITFHDSLTRNGTLEVVDVTYSDYGVYTCKGFSAVDEETFNISSNVTLTSKLRLFNCSCNKWFFFPVSPEGSVMVTPSMVVVNRSATISATCSAGGGPDNQFTWSVINALDEVNFVQNGPTIEINVVVWSDSIYRCSVENSAGFEEANLTIYSK